MRGKALGVQRLLAIVVEAGALQPRFRGGKVCLRLLDGRDLRHHLPGDASDGRLLGCDLGAGRVDGDLVVAIVDPEDHFALAHHRVVAGRDRRNVAGDARAEDGVVGADIGIVGRDVEPPDQRVIDAVACRSQRKQREDADQHDLALGRFWRGGIACRGGRGRGIGRGGRLVDGRRGRRLRAAALGLLGDMGAELLGQGRRQGR
jgi:hypothetical protein